MTQPPIAARVIRFLRIAIPSLIFGLGISISSMAQVHITLNDFSAFKNPGENWKLAGSVVADLNQSNVLISEKGKGILVNRPDKEHHGSDLYTNEEFSDIDLELDYMMAKNSNSGIYLQGRYEVQLRDSWGLLQPSPANNGGIYERFDVTRGKGNEGYEGYAPRVNVSRAPGLWQHMKISFQAPRFDAAGRKTANAKILRLELNGVVIHENVELSGPTRGGMDKEVAAGPLRLQGDHGEVAFRNLVIKVYKGRQPVLTDVHYSLYNGKYETVPDFSSLKPDEEGSLNTLSTSFLKKDESFLIRYTGTVQIDEPGEYIFQRETNGMGRVKINEQIVSDFASYTTTPVHLTTGKFPFEIVYTKPMNWFPTSFGLTVSSSVTRELLISDPASLFREYPDPIHIDARDNLVLRSFMDIPDGKRVVHAANVGSPQQLHYSFDLDYGMIFQLWRGGFLDATPMWYSRGDGSSTPLGSRLQFGTPRQTIFQLGSIKDSIPTDTSGTGFTSKGYELDHQNRTIFIYQTHGAHVRDAFQVSENGQELKRTLSISTNPGNLYMLMAEGKTIQTLSKGWYLIDDHSYYIRIDSSDVSPIVRQTGDHSELLAPLQHNLSYSILY